MVGGEVSDQRTPRAVRKPFMQNPLQDINSSWSHFRLAKPAVSFRRSYDSFITSLSLQRRYLDRRSAPCPYFYSRLEEQLEEINGMQLPAPSL
jgi:hypothetical protein